MNDETIVYFKKDGKLTKVRMNGLGDDVAETMGTVNLEAMRKAVGADSYSPIMAIAK